MNGNENKNDRKLQSSWLYAKKVKKVFSSPLQ